jgi:hypothetical protein
VQEKEYYEQFPNLKVRWQPKAWADESIMFDYMVDFRRQTLHKGDVAILLDNHGSQQTDRIRNLMHVLDMEAVYTPPNCTDCVSPVDRNIGVWLKHRVYKMQNDELDMPENRNWPLPAKEGGLTAAQKRMHTARWMAQAWEEFKKSEQHNCRSAFVDTGVLIAADGSENHLIKLWPKAPAGHYKF